MPKLEGWQKEQRHRLEMLLSRLGPTRETVQSGRFRTGHCEQGDWDIKSLLGKRIHWEDKIRKTHSIRSWFVKAQDETASGKITTLTLPLYPTHDAELVTLLKTEDFIALLEELQDAYKELGVEE